MTPAPASGRAAPRRRWGLWIGSVLALIVAAAAVVLHSPWMSVQEIDIVGADHADVAARLEAAGVGEGAIMVWVSPDAVEEAVLGDPWVREAWVQRVLPSTLVIEVLEHTPLLWAEGSTGWMLVSRAGSVIEVADAPREGLVQVRLGFGDHPPGAVPDDPSWREVVDLALTVDATIAETIAIEIDAGVVWTSVDGVAVRLGPPVALADKARVLAAILDEGVPAGWSVDLMAPRRPALVPPSIRDQAELVAEEGAP